MERGDEDVELNSALPRASRDRPRAIELVLHAPAAATSLAVIRHTVGGTASSLGLDAARVADVRLALTEAVTAAIRRADPEETLEIRADLSDGALRIAVRDGGGALPINDDLPLPLVAALSDAVEVSHLNSGGTEVAMTFAFAA